MSDIDKAKALSNLRTDSTTLAERTFFAQTGLATYGKEATATIQKLASGNLGKYTGSSKASSTKSKATGSTKTKTAKKSSSRKTAKAKTYNLSAILKASATIKPPTPPKISVKKAPAPKKVALKKYTPTKATISKSSKISLRRGIV